MPFFTNQKKTPKNKTLIKRHLASNKPPISAAIRIPSLNLIATTEDPVTYGYLKMRNQNLGNRKKQRKNQIARSRNPKFESKEG